jgi:enoyl-[acyl-carrier protein] reductase II
MKTRLTDMLECEHPVMLAGMGGVSYADVVAAVSEAGGFGTLGASTMGDSMVEEMRKVKAQTSKPFGVDLLTAIPGQVERQVQSVIDEGARLFVAGLGVPRDVVDLCHDNNVLVATVCGKVKHTVAAVAAGCDFVIAQGTEGGGHTGVIGTLPLVAQSVEAVGDKVPVVAAGGIHDGRGLAAALALGADGVWVGTRFIATPEAWGVKGYKETLLSLPEDGTVISKAFTGKTCRVVRNDYTQRFEDDPSALQPFPQQALQSMKDGVNHLGASPDTDVDVKTEFMPAGQGVGGIHELVPAGELVRRFMLEAEEAIDRISKLRS